MDLSRQKDDSTNKEHFRDPSSMSDPGGPEAKGAIPPEAPGPHGGNRFATSENPEMLIADGAGVDEIEE